MDDVHGRSPRRSAGWPAPLGMGAIWRGARGPATGGGYENGQGCPAAVAPTPGGSGSGRLLLLLRRRVAAEAGDRDQHEGRDGIAEAAHRRAEIVAVVAGGGRRGRGPSATRHRRTVALEVPRRRGGRSRSKRSGRSASIRSGRSPRSGRSRPLRSGGHRSARACRRSARAVARSRSGARRARRAARSRGGPLRSRSGRAGRSPVASATGPPPRRCRAPGGPDARPARATRSLAARPSPARATVASAAAGIAAAAAAAAARRGAATAAALGRAAASAISSLLTGSRPSISMRGIGWPVSFSIAATLRASSGVARVKACALAGRRGRCGRCGGHSPRRGRARRS